MIYLKHLPAILYLLVALAKKFECPFKLPDNVTLNVVVVQVSPFFMYLLNFLYDIHWFLLYFDVPYLPEVPYITIV